MRHASTTPGPEWITSTTRRSRARRWTAAVVRAIGLAIFVVGLGLAILAAIQWLQTAHWQPLTVSGLLAHWPTSREWVSHPQSWQGLHRIVSWTLRVPMFLIATLVGAAMALAGTA